MLAHFLHQFEMKHRVLSFNCHHSHDNNNNESNTDKMSNQELIRSLDNDWNLANKVSY